MTHSCVHDAEDPYARLARDTSGDTSGQTENPFPASNPGAHSSRHREFWVQFDDIHAAGAASNGIPGSHANRGPTRSHVTNPNIVTKRSSSEFANGGLQTALETLGESQEEQQEEHLDSVASFRAEQELILPLPLQKPHARLVVGIASLQLVCGLAQGMLGVVVSAVLGSFRSSRDGPALWWTGLLPFLLGFWGIYAGGKKRRKRVWQWGVVSLLVIFTQTALMGVAGNFSTSNYDVWLYTGTRYDRPVCEQRDRKCFCQDFLHGAESHLELPEVTYTYEKVKVGNWEETIKWRQVRLKSCPDVTLITRIYLSLMGVWGLFCIISVVACTVAHAVSICAKQDINYRHRLRDGEEEVDPERQILADHTPEPEITPCPNEDITETLPTDTTHTMTDTHTSRSPSPQTEAVGDTLEPSTLRVDVDVHRHDVT